MSLAFKTANGRFVYECPKCQTFTMTEANGSWACRGCAKSVMVHVDRVVYRKGFRPKKQRKAALAVVGA